MFFLSIFNVIYYEALYKQVVGVQGMLKGGELSAAYASADIFMMPSETETLGFVALEAMASGLPVVAVAAGGLTDIITQPGITSKSSSSTCALALTHLGVAHVILAIIAGFIDITKFVSVLL